MYVVLCTAPSEAAESLASKLVEERVAACVNVLPGVMSVYRWKGAVERAGEALLVVKTSGDALSALVARLRALHPYEVPEIVAIEPAHVDAAYAAWVDAETKSVEKR